MSKYAVCMVPDAVQDLQTLTMGNQALYLRWMQEALGENPQAESVLLRGVLDGFRCSSRPQRIQVIFGIDESTLTVVIVCVLPGAISLAAKQAELEQRVKAMQGRRSHVSLDALFARFHQATTRD